MGSLGSGVALLVLMLAAALIVTAVTAGTVTWDDFIKHHQDAAAQGPGGD